MEFVIAKPQGTGKTASASRVPSFGWCAGPGLLEKYRRSSLKSEVQKGYIWNAGSTLLQEGSRIITWSMKIERNEKNVSPATCLPLLWVLLEKVMQTCSTALSCLECNKSTWNVLSLTKNCSNDLVSRAMSINHSDEASALKSTSNLAGNEERDQKDHYTEVPWEQHHQTLPSRPRAVRSTEWFIKKMYSSQLGASQLSARLTHLQLERSCSATTNNKFKTNDTQISQHTTIAKRSKSNKWEMSKFQDFQH